MKRFFSSPILGGILLILLGLILIISPKLSIQVIMVCIASIFLLRGIFSIITYFSSKDSEFFSQNMLFQGFIDIAFGLIILFCMNYISSAISIILGLWALISGGCNLCITIKSKYTMSKKYWIREIISSSIQSIFGILCIISPMWGFSTVIVLFGIVILLSGIATIFFSNF